MGYIPVAYDLDLLPHPVFGGIFEPKQGFPNLKM